jgi:hypothetical protein
MGVHRIAATEIPQDRSAIDTGGFTATVGEFDAPEGHGDWRRLESCVWWPRSTPPEHPQVVVATTRVGDTRSSRCRLVTREICER